MFKTCRAVAGVARKQCEALLGNDTAWGEGLCGVCQGWIHLSFLPALGAVFTSSVLSSRASNLFYNVWMWTPSTLRTHSKPISMGPGMEVQSQEQMLNFKVALYPCWSPDSQMTGTSYVLFNFPCTCVCVWYRAFQKKGSGSGPFAWV